MRSGPCAKVTPWSAPRQRKRRGGPSGRRATTSVGSARGKRRRGRGLFPLAAGQAGAIAVASHEELQKVVGRLGLTYGPMPNEIVHNLCTAVIAPDGTLARLEVGAAGKTWQPDDLLRTILERAAPAK